MDNLISRQAAIDTVTKHYRAHDNDLLEVIAYEIEQLPSEEPERKKGKWVDGYKRQMCSVCKQRGYRSWDFCPNCGSYNGGGA